MIRPLSLDNLRAMLNRKVREFNRTVKNEKGLRAVLVIHLEECFPTTRHEVCKSLFPETSGSTKDLSIAQICAILDWLGYIRIADDRNTYGYVAGPTTETARLEGEQAVTQYRLSHGQNTLAL